MPNEDLPVSATKSLAEKLLGVRAYELVRDAIENEVLTEREEIKMLIEFFIDDLETALKRLDKDGTILYDTLGEDVHTRALELDRRLAAAKSLTRQSERMHFADSLVPAE